MQPLGARGAMKKNRVRRSECFPSEISFIVGTPKTKRPELWSLYNTKVNPGESIRVFPLSNWTELDVWQYIYLENIPLPGLYFAKERPVVFRNGTWIMVDDDRLKLKPGEKVEQKMVRFRTLDAIH